VLSTHKYLYFNIGNEPCIQLKLFVSLIHLFNINELEPKISQNFSVIELVILKSHQLSCYTTTKHISPNLQHFLYVNNHNLIISLDPKTLDVQSLSLIIGILENFLIPIITPTIFQNLRCSFTIISFRITIF
jgi:hypothetical protein